MGLYMDDDGDPDTERQAVFQQFDAFGNDMSKPLSSTSSFAWRGQEGSVTDRASGLIYMQARHYDPSIGRFIQADVLPIASLTTQGMNRYNYCENDPVNFSDPTGKAAQNSVVAIAHVALALLLPVLGTALLMAATAGTTLGLVAGIFSMFAGFFGGLSFMMSALGYFFPDTACTLDPASVVLSLIAAGFGIPGLFSTAGSLMQAANIYRAADLLGLSNTAIDAFVYDW